MSFVLPVFNFLKLQPSSLRNARRLLLMLALASSLFSQNITANAAVQGSTTFLPALPDARYSTPVPSKDNKEPESENKDTAIAEISGSPFPGIIDHLLQRPLPDDSIQPGKPNIHINYPSIGNFHIDSDIRQWVNEIAEAFENHLIIQRTTQIMASDDTDEGLSGFYLDDDLNSSGNDSGQQNEFELWGNYKVSRPSDSAISITFELWNYTGSGAANLDIITLNYSLLTGQRLGLVDIFEKPDTALELMSNWAREKLAPKLGINRASQMLLDGTAPLVENFSSLTLMPNGICINFQPYQVASWDAGIQKVLIPLDALTSSMPLLALWGK